MIFDRLQRWFEDRGQYKAICDGDNNPYLRRWYLFRDKREDGTRRSWNIMLHNIKQPDHDRHLHNHPWRFKVLILRRGYMEETPTGVYHRPPLSFRTMGPDSFHRIHSLPNGEAWTLVFRGRPVQMWGFKVKGAFMKFYDYLAQYGLNPHGTCE